MARGVLMLMNEMSRPWCYYPAQLLFGLPELSSGQVVTNNRIKAIFAPN